MRNEDREQSKESSFHSFEEILQGHADMQQNEDDLEEDPVTSTRTKPVMDSAGGTETSLGSKGSGMTINRKKRFTSSLGKSSLRKGGRSRGGRMTVGGKMKSSLRSNGPGMAISPKKRLTKSLRKSGRRKMSDTCELSGGYDKDEAEDEQCDGKALVFRPKPAHD